MRIPNSLHGVLLFCLVSAASPLLAGDNLWASLETIDEPAGPEGKPTTVVAADPGVEAVMKSESRPHKEPLATHDPNKTAEQLLREVMKANGYDDIEENEKKHRYFSLQIDLVNLEDPVGSPGFFVSREVALRRAFLRAKADVARWMFTTMSAEDLLEYPGSVPKAKFGKSYEEAKANVDAQRQVVAKLLRQYDVAEAKKLEGVTTIDRIQALMDAALKKLDATYSKEKIEAAKAAAYEKTKQSYQAAVDKLKKVEQDAAALQEQVKSTFESRGSEMASMPVSGATVIDQAESWNETKKRYEVAVLVCWSPVLEKAAQIALSGKPVAIKTDTPQKTKLQAWLNGQSLAAMIGPRQYVDAEGNRWYLGISARPTSDDAFEERENRSKADVFARQLAVFSLFSQVDSFVTARILARELTDADQKMTRLEASDYLTEKMSQKFENLPISGIKQITSGTHVHPLTGKEVYVGVWGISASSAAEAMKARVSQLKAARDIYKEIAFQRGKIAGQQAAVEAAKKDADPFRSGTAEGTKEIGGTKPTPGTKPDPTKPVPPKPDPTKPSTATQGAFRGGGTIFDDF